MKFKRPEDPIQKALDAEILMLFQDMRHHTEYDKYREQTLDAIVRLMEVRSKGRFSKDAIVAAATHVAGLVLVLQHERVHVIASKAFGLIKKIV